MTFDRSTCATAAIIVAGGLVLTACAAGPVLVVTPEQRAALAPVIDPVVTDFFPGMPVAPTTGCIIANATVAEARELAGLNGRAAVAPVLGIANRPETLDCIAANGLPALVGPG